MNLLLSRILTYLNGSLVDDCYYRFCKFVVYNYLEFEDMSFELGTKADEKVTFEHIKQIQKVYEKRLRKLGFKGKLHYIYSKKTDDGIIFLKE